jgi:Ala-tRNA(Pro) deacylase
LIFFKKHNIEYKLFEHQPVFTVQDKPIVTKIDGIETSNESIPSPNFKTLFLKDTSSKFFLVSVTEDKRVDLKALSEMLGCGRFSFGKAEELLEILQLTPGSVTPYGLIFDQQNQITFVLDEDSLTHSYVSFHPLRNDMTIVTTTQAFLTCMKEMGHQPKIIRIPVK